MYQSILDQCVDVLFPVLCGVAVWFLLHYVVLTPRILKVEMPLIYDSVVLSEVALPQTVHDCLKSRFAKGMLAVGRFEAAVYTASLRHISAPFQARSLDAIEHLDSKCGTSQAIARKKEQQRLAEEARIQQQKEQLLAFKQQQRLEAERLRDEAKAKAKRLKEEQKQRMIQDVFELFFQGRR